ncbi:MAG: protein-tyrosine phosphatase [Hydrogenophaga sp.]|jgi:protein-tyrosine phosphatase
MGNICRSPLAASALQAQLEQRGLTDRIEVDSAGTYAGHQGEKADPRAVMVATARGYQQIHRERARRVGPHDFERFDLLLAMDRDNLAHLQQQCPPEHAHKLHLFLDFAGEGANAEVPDPYYGNTAGFERVVALCEAGAAGILRRLAPVTG